MEELYVAVNVSTIVHSSTGENMSLRYLHKKGLVPPGKWPLLLEAALRNQIPCMKYDYYHQNKYP